MYMRKTPNPIGMFTLINCGVSEICVIFLAVGTFPSHGVQDIPSEISSFVLCIWCFGREKLWANIVDVLSWSDQTANFYLSVRKWLKYRRFSLEILTILVSHNYGTAKIWHEIKVADFRINCLQRIEYYNFTCLRILVEIPVHPCLVTFLSPMSLHQDLGYHQHMITSMSRSGRSEHSFRNLRIYL